ncbi:hypothetical protein [Ferrovibrio sp.]|uniref:hypothetical protein n=1 Tax=Ferrovibrio sp. TaxID=1917215 RepID=UPI003D141309
MFGRYGLAGLAFGMGFMLSRGAASPPGFRRMELFDPSNGQRLVFDLPAADFEAGEARGRRLWHIALGLCLVLILAAELALRGSIWWVYAPGVLLPGAGLYWLLANAWRFEDRALLALILDAQRRGRWPSGAALAG